MHSSQDNSVDSHGDLPGPKVASNGGSVLDTMEDVIRFGLGHKTKKEWIMALSVKHKLNFIGIQETKMSSVSQLEAACKYALWEYISTLLARWKGEVIILGDFNEKRDDPFQEETSRFKVDHSMLGQSGGILCIWEATIFKKDHVTVSDNFVAVYGKWLPN
nr:RNA-directed DNA polymerase, eukaryota [Tanacetum cinerariifolium]